MLSAPLSVRDIAGTVARLLLAGVWLVSGGLKLADPGQTFVAVQAYDALPAAAVGPVAAALPLAEIVLGLVLLAGLRTRAAALASAVLLTVFVAGVAQAWARGLSIDCGCFGGGGTVAESGTEYPREIAVDLGLLALAVWLVVRPATRWSLQGWLGGRAAAPEAADTPENVMTRSGR